jgi:hypothetical protein
VLPADQQRTSAEKNLTIGIDIALTPTNRTNPLDDKKL